MRVLITTDVVGGVWQFTQGLAAGLLRNGCAVALVSFGGSPSSQQSRQCEMLQSEHGSDFRHEASAAPLEWMQQNDRAYSDAAPLLAQVAREFDAELLHSNQFCFGALSLDIPKIITAHSDVLSWAEACRDEPLENSAWLRQYVRLVTDGLAGSNAVVAPTQWMLSALTRHFPVRARCHIIPNGRTLPSASSGVRQLRAITAGRLWDEAKDIRMLEKVSSPFLLFAAGDAQYESNPGPQSLGAVTLLGRLPEDELLAFFRESTIYICTSRYEPFGLAPLEAALSGCAVLARDIPSLHEVWQEGALYFSDAASLSALLENLHASPERLRSVRRASLARARRFTSERMVKAYHALFTRVLHESGATTYAA